MTMTVLKSRPSKLVRTAVVLLLMTVAGALTAKAGAGTLSAAKVEKPPAGMAKYLVVLWEAGTPIPGDQGKGKMKRVAEPDWEKLGGSLVSSRVNERVVYLPFGVAKKLRRNEAVSSYQRIWAGESLEGWDESEDPTGTMGDSFEALRGEPETAPEDELQWQKSYNYDADGNITDIGGDHYTYDNVGRLTQATVGGKSETYRYDAFGNLIEKTLAGASELIAVDPSSNRLSGVDYDAAGNVTARTNKGTYEYDSLNMISGYKTTFPVSQERRILYDANDERIGTLIGNLQRWTIRDFEGQIIREYTGYQYGTQTIWSWKLDQIRGEGQLVAGESQEWWFEPTNFRYGGKRHYHLDHLGSVRAVTNSAGRSISEHDYFPFGATQTKTYQEQINWGDPHTDGMRFAGHWRDFLGQLDVEGNDYLDSMHARYYDPNLGRFLSVDPVLDMKKALKAPQRWNRYAYVINNPLRFSDPTGREVALPIDCANNIPCKEIRDIRNGLPLALRIFVRATTLKDGRVVVNKNLLNAVSDTMGSANFASLRHVVNAKSTVVVDTRSEAFVRVDSSTGRAVGDKYTRGGMFRGSTVTPNEWDVPATAVSVNPFDDAREAAATLAHELYGHADFYVAGLPYKHPPVPMRVFEDIENEVYRNFGSWPF